MFINTFFKKIQPNKHGKRAPVILNKKERFYIEHIQGIHLLLQETRRDLHLQCGLKLKEKVRFFFLRL